jgi:hypothetical protein
MFINLPPALPFFLNLPTFVFTVFGGMLYLRNNSLLLGHHGL